MTHSACTHQNGSPLVKYNSMNAWYIHFDSQKFLLAYGLLSYPFTNGMSGLSCAYRLRMPISWSINYSLSVSCQCQCWRNELFIFTDSGFSILQIVFVIFLHSYNATIATHFSLTLNFIMLFCAILDVTVVRLP